MNPYQYPVTCSVCGEQGMSHVRHTGLEYLGGTFTHKNPLVCRENIEARKRRDKQKHEQSQTCAMGTGI